MGYRQIRIMDGDSLQTKKYARAEENLLKMNSSALTFLTNGTIGIFDKETGKELFSVETRDARQL